MLNLWTAIPRYLDLCYTVPMNTDQHMWRAWVSAIRRWGLEDWVGTMLEAAGPLTILGAQVVYLGQPMFGLALPKGHLEAVARMLEEPESTRAFVDLLREASSP